MLSTPHEHACIRISVQVSQLLLRWCCNTRNVHLLRAMPCRLVQEVADRHDQAVKVAFAATLGMVDVQAVRDATHLHSVSRLDVT